MAITHLDSPRFKAVYAATGEPLASGTVTVYQTGTTTDALIYSDDDKTAQLSNPATLNAAGELEIWFEGTVDVLVKDSDGNLQYQMNGIQELNTSGSTTSTSSSGNNLCPNGDFEDVTGTAADQWDITSGTAVVTSTAADVASGTYALECTDVTVAESAPFPVAAGESVDVSMWFKGDSATNNYSAKIDWLNSSKVSLASLTTVFEYTGSGAPTSWSFERKGNNTAPANTAYALIQLNACAGVETGTTHFDRVLVEVSDLFTYDSSNYPLIIDDDGNELLEFSSSTTPVNQLKITSADAGSNPIISTNGTTDDTGIDLKNKAGEQFAKFDMDANPTVYPELRATAGGDVEIHALGVVDKGFLFKNSDDETTFEIDAAASTDAHVKVVSSSGGAPAIGVGGAAGRGLIFQDSDGATAFSVDAAASADTYLSPVAQNGAAPIIRTLGSADKGVIFNNAAGETNFAIGQNSGVTAPDVYISVLSGTAGGTYDFPSIQSAGTADKGINFVNNDAEAIFQMSSGANPANYIQSFSSATTVWPGFKAQGEADKGILFYDSNGNQSFQCGTTTATPGNENFIAITPKDTGTAPTISAVGNSDANVDINLVPKGTGVVTADGDEVVTLTGTQTLTNKTLTSPTINTAPTISATALTVGGNDVVGSNVFSNNADGSPTISSTLLSVDLLTEGTWVEIDDTDWTALASLPTDIDWIEVGVYAEVADTGATIGNTNELKVWARDDGSSAAANAATAIAMCSAVADSNTDSAASTLSTAKIPVTYDGTATSLKFEIRWQSTFVLDPTIDVSLRGYGYNP